MNEEIKNKRPQLMSVLNNIISLCIGDMNSKQKFPYTPKSLPECLCRMMYEDNRHVLDLSKCWISNLKTLIGEIEKEQDLMSYRLYNKNKPKNNKNNEQNKDGIVG
jgi:hypothetical protein